MKVTEKRDNVIDLLKFIGLSAIILAHVNPPSIIYMARSFDVPLMVLLSSILARISYERFRNSNQSPFVYIFFRIRRLVFPTWIFLTLYFALLLCGGKVFDIKYYLASYGLTRYGTGYVWIILIYVYISVFVPLFDKMRFSPISVLIIICTYIIYEVGYYFHIGVHNKIIETTLYYMIPYGMLAYMGYYYTGMKEKTRKSIMALSIIVFVFCGSYYWYVYGTPQLVEIAKYPPRLYYLSYGIACSFLLLHFCKKRYRKCIGGAFIKFVSIHSMWIYLWHILWLVIYGVLHLPSFWIAKYLFAYGGAIITTYIVNRILDFFEKKHSLPFIMYLRG